MFLIVASAGNAGTSVGMSGSTCGLILPKYKRTGGAFHCLNAQNVDCCLKSVYTRLLFRELLGVRIDECFTLGRQSSFEQLCGALCSRHRNLSIVLGAREESRESIYIYLYIWDVSNCRIKSEKNSVFTVEPTQQP